MSALSRDRLGWWGYAVALAVVAAAIAYAFLDLLTLGLFGYFATRPISDRVEAVVDSDGIAAALTVLTVLVRVFLVALYAVAQLVQQLRRRFDGGIASLLTARFGNLDAIPGWLLTSPGRLLANPPSLEQVTGFLSGPRLERALGLLGTAFDTLLLLRWRPSSPTRSCGTTTCSRPSSRPSSAAARRPPTPTRWPSTTTSKPSSTGTSCSSS